MTTTLVVVVDEFGYVRLSPEDAELRRSLRVRALRIVKDKLAAIQKELDGLADEFGNIPCGPTGADFDLAEARDMLEGVVDRIDTAALGYERYKPGADEPEFAKVRASDQPLKNACTKLTFEARGTEVGTPCVRCGRPLWEHP